MSGKPTVAMSRAGGFARAARLSPERRAEIARSGGIAKSQSLLSGCLECGREIKARNLCPKHLQRLYRARWERKHEETLEPRPTGQNGDRNKPGIALSSADGFADEGWPE